MTPLDGWVRFPRAVAAEAWYRDGSPFLRALYLHLVMSANFRAGKTRTGLKLKPGQVVTSWSRLADEMAGVENGKRIAPTAWKVRYTAGLLKRAGLIAWSTARPTAGGGLVITLDRWALHAADGESTAGTTHELPQTPLRELPQHRKNNYRPAVVQAEKGTLELVEEWKQRERESMQELREVRARERGEAVR